MKKKVIKKTKSNFTSNEKIILKRIENIERRQFEHQIQINNQITKLLQIIVDPKILNEISTDYTSKKHKLYWIGLFCWCQQDDIRGRFRPL